MRTRYVCHTYLTGFRFSLLLWPDCLLAAVVLNGSSGVCFRAQFHPNCAFCNVIQSTGEKKKKKKKKKKKRITERFTSRMESQFKLIQICFGTAFNIFENDTVIRIKQLFQKPLIFEGVFPQIRFVTPILPQGTALLGSNYLVVKYHFY